MFNPLKIMTPLAFILVVCAGFAFGLWYAVVELKIDSSMAIVAGLIVAVVASVFCTVFIRFTK